jgi:hypothetical protein
VGGGKGEGGIVGGSEGKAVGRGKARIGEAGRRDVAGTPVNAAIVRCHGWKGLIDLFPSEKRVTEIGEEARAHKAPHRKHNLAHIIRPLPRAVPAVKMDSMTTRADGRRIFSRHSERQCAVRSAARGQHVALPDPETTVGATRRRGTVGRVAGEEGAGGGRGLRGRRGGGWALGRGRGREEGEGEVLREGCMAGCMAASVGGKKGAVKVDAEGRGGRRRT